MLSSSSYIFMHAVMRVQLGSRFFLGAHIYLVPTAESSASHLLASQMATHVFLEH